MNDLRFDSLPTRAVAKPAVVELWVRSLLFSLGMLLSTVVCGLAIVLGFALPFNRRYRLSQSWSRFNIWWLRVTCRIDYRVSGTEHIPDRPIIVMAKHQSTWETLFLQQYLQPTAWVVKRELLWLPFFGWALKLLRPIAIDRRAGSSAVKQVIRQGIEHLRRGQWILIFPEGTRTAPASANATAWVARCWPRAAVARFCRWPTMPGNSGRDGVFSNVRAPYRWFSVP